MLSQTIIYATDLKITELQTNPGGKRLEIQTDKHGKIVIKLFAEDGKTVEVEGA